MNEKKSMSNVLTIFITIIVIALAVVLGMYIGKEYILNNGTNNESGENNKETGKIDNNKDYVYTTYSFNFDDYLSNDFEGEIPYVNINSDYAKEINKAMDKKIKEIKELINSIKNGSNVVFRDSYEWYLNNNILSLQIRRVSGPGGFESFDIYNIDIKTGKRVDNADILASKNLSIDDLYNKLINFIDSYYNTQFGSLDNCKNDNICNWAHTKTLKIYENKTNLLTNFSMFLDNEGNINIAGKICETAGAIDADGGPYPYPRIITIK